MSKQAFRFDRFAAVLAAGLLAGLSCRALAQTSIAPRERYAAAVAALERFIGEVANKDLPALSIALVDDQTIVWARGFGLADPNRKIPATAETVYRVGSVSKLFTDIAIMQSVERGVLDLDAPVNHYLPDFKPANPSGKAITLRHLMAHRSGLVGELPVGHYFDPTHPSLAETVRSLNATELVYPPETRVKYSNAAIATAGYVLESVQKEPFAVPEACRARPVGAEEKRFRADSGAHPGLAKAYMWTYHGRVFEAPTFSLGMAPAGSMYATVNDLGRFLSVLFAGGQGPGGPVRNGRCFSRCGPHNLPRRENRPASASVSC